MISRNRNDLILEKVFLDRTGEESVEFISINAPPAIPFATLNFLEVARGEFFRHLGPTFLQWQEHEKPKRLPKELISLTKPYLKSQTS
jgi:hypothetical protein